MFKCHCICFKVVNEQDPKYIDNMFITRNVSSTLRFNRVDVTVFMEKEVGASCMVTEPLKSMAQNFGTTCIYKKRNKNYLILINF